MEVEQVAALLRATIMTAFLVGSPLLGTALVVGLFVSIIQSATQINEQTLTMIPKIACVFGLFAALFPWIMTTIMDFAKEIYAMIGQSGAT